MLNIVIVVIVVASSFWVYLDATKNKIGKIPDAGGMLNLAAGGWALVTLFLWIIGFPAYLLKRKALIDAAQQNPVEAKARGIKAAVIGIVGGFWILGALVSYTASALPACDAPEVVSLAEQLIQNAPLIKMSGLRINNIKSPAEKNYDSGAEKRTCRGVLSHAMGEEPVYYTVEWHDKSKGSIWVQIYQE